VLTAGALALAVITPTLDQAEHGTDAVSTPLQTLPVTPDLAEHALGAAIQTRQLDEQEPLRNRLRELRFDAGLEPAPVRDGLENRVASAQRVSRAMPRRAVATRPATRVRPIAPVLRRPAAGFARQAARPLERPAVRTVERPAVRTVERPAVRTVERPAVREPRAVRATRTQAARPARKRVVVQRKRVSVSNRGVVRSSTRSTSVRRLRASGGSGDMRAVIAYARSQLGKRYVPGGVGPGGFDCSGFTKRAYAKAGLSLPHSSGAQARRAKSVSRSKARPGDLVVGRGHVGIYMGDGMMIDAGNRRTGVVYRKLYRGLSVSRLK
jgi:cell wall-associated NlpC family hydrolase